jgi:predicted Rossmann fold flavoprotein
MKKYRVLIIGAGASGLLAASNLPEGTAVAEKNAVPGRKLYATGNGRCNYLNMAARAEDFASAGEPEAAKAFTEAVFEALPVSLLRSRLSTLGIEGRTEEEGRVYPRSGQAASVVKALVSAAERTGAEILTSFEVKSAERTPGGFLVRSSAGDEIRCERLIIATGGKAGIQYGCEGTGFKLAAAFGHHVIKPIPALTGLIAAEDISAIAGVRANAKVTLSCGRESHSASGEVQFTKDSISGICTFDVSRWLRIPENGKNGRFSLSADLFEEIPGEELCGVLSARKEALKGCCAGDIFNTLVPEKLGAYIFARCGLDPARDIASLGGADIEKIARSCKALEFGIASSRGWKDAQVTSGGVSLEEVDPYTMESKLVPGLYLTGEVLDADGPCGGYNLTWAFATGALAAEAIKEQLDLR